MTIFSSRLLSTMDPSDWDRVVKSYNEVIYANIRERVGQMSTDDIDRYSAKYNTPTSTSEDVLSHMLEWGGFKGMLLSGGLVKNDSPLFNRLMRNEPALPHSPPRSFGKSWYELLDFPESEFECQVMLSGIGRRKREVNQSVWLMSVNECLWACRDGSEKGMMLIGADALWRDSNAEQRAELWKEIQSYFIENEISFKLTYGQWEQPFTLCLRPRLGVEIAATLIAQMPPPMSDSVFSFAHVEPNFPLRWLLRR